MFTLCTFSFPLLLFLSHQPTSFSYVCICACAHGHVCAHYKIQAPPIRANCICFLSLGFSAYYEALQLQPLLPGDIPSLLFIGIKPFQVHGPHFIYSPTDGHLGRLCILAIMNRAALTMDVQVSLQYSDLDSFPYIPNVLYQLAYRSHNGQNIQSPPSRLPSSLSQKPPCKNFQDLQSNYQLRNKWTTLDPLRDSSDPHCNKLKMAIMLANNNKELCKPLNIHPSFTVTWKTT